MRRDCSLTLDEYLWHEKRTFNKCSLAGTKVDISGVVVESEDALQAGTKLEHVVVTARVLDASGAFDYPAIYHIDHPTFQYVVSFTPTYAGQAQKGELIEVAGWSEQLADGRLRLIIGTSREAAGEYLRVVPG